MAVTRRFVQAWREFWFEPVPPHVFALLRILIGAVALKSLFALHDIATFWALDGFVPVAGSGGAREWLIGHGWTDQAGYTAYGAALAATAAMTIGLWSRVSVPLAFVAALGQVWWNGLPVSGADDLLRGVLFCLMWVDCGGVWSVDAWWRRRQRPGAPPPGVAMAPLRLIRFQLALMYLSAGLWKLQGRLWRDGAAVHYVLQANVFQRFPETLLPSAEWFTVAATYVTLFWELLFAGALWYRPARRLTLAVGVIIHLGMMSLIEIGPFHLVALASYAAFLEPSSMAGWLRAHPWRRIRLADGASTSTASPA